MNLNNIAKRTYLSALERGKISMVTDENALDKETIRSLLEETTEVITADNGASRIFLNTLIGRRNLRT